jgi:hypothetical protein
MWNSKQLEEEEEERVLPEIVGDAERHSEDDEGLGWLLARFGEAIDQKPSPPVSSMAAGAAPVDGPIEPRGLSGTRPNGPVSSQEGSGDGGPLCVVCDEAVVGMAVLPCFHVCVCGECAEKVLKQGRCPMCRTPVERMHRVYLP